jgi:hypothetical protein
LPIAKLARTTREPPAVADQAEALKRLRGFKKHCALFSRSGFTKPLVQQAIQENVLLFNGPDFQRIS